MSGLKKIGTTRKSFDHIETADFTELTSPTPSAFFSTIKGKIVLGCIASIGASFAIISAAALEPIQSSAEDSGNAAIVATATPQAATVEDRTAQEAGSNVAAATKSASALAVRRSGTKAAGHHLSDAERLRANGIENMMCYRGGEPYLVTYDKREHKLGFTTSDGTKSETVTSTKVGRDSFQVIGPRRESNPSFVATFSKKAGGSSYSRLSGDGNIVIEDRCE